MGKVTVKIEKVSGGYTATATDGHQFTKVSPQKHAADAERLAVKLFKKGIIDWVVPYPQDENEMSGGSHANETDIIEALNSTSTGNDFGNSYWFGLLVVVIFLGAIFLTNSCLGL